MQKIKKLLRVYFWPSWMLFVAVEICLTILFLYLNFTKDLNQTAALGTEAALMLITTFTGIFVPLQLNRNQKKGDDRRALVFMLGSIWTELRKNDFALEQIIVNYKFPFFPETISFLEQLKLLLAKHNLVSRSVELISDSALLASQNSGNISTFDDDDIYNSVTQAYENIGNVKLISVTNEENIKMKIALIENTPESLSRSEEEMFKEEIYGSLNLEYQNIFYLKTLIKKAIDNLDRKLNSMGVKAKLEPRDMSPIPDMPQIPVSLTQSVPPPQIS